MTNSSARIPSSLILLLIVLGLSFSKVHAADDVPVLIDKVETDTMKPEKVGASRGGGGGSRDSKWVIIEFSYTVTPDKDSKNPFIDEVQFKANIEARDGAGDSRSTDPVILTGDVTYVCVPAGKGFGSLYIPPDVAARYSLDRYLSQFNVNIQAFVGGQMVDSKDKRREQKEDWFSGYKTVSGLVYNKMQSPFILNDTDRYPAIKLMK